MNIQINNSFDLRLRVLAQGEREPMTAATDVRVVFQCLDNGVVRWQAQCLTITDEEVVVEVSPDEARSLGRYMVGVFYSIGGAQRYAENGAAFSLVRTAAEADAEGESVAADLTVRFAASGKNGLSAYEIAQQNGYAGTFEEWLLAGENANNASVAAVEAAALASRAGANAQAAAAQAATDTAQAIAAAQAAVKEAVARAEVATSRAEVAAQVAEEAAEGVAEELAAEVARATAAENKLAADITNAPKEALRQLYVTFGASYNGAKDTFTFNTLEGLSWAEMAATFLYRDIVYRLDLPRVGQQISNLRVINPLPNILTSPAIKIQGLNTFYGTAIELLAFCRLSASSFDTYLNSVRTDTAPVCTYLYDTFRQCSKLKVVFPINLDGCQTLKKETFERCVALEELRLLKLPLSLNLAESPLISKESILYIITNAAPTTAITITLHADAYARLANDADIVAALEAQPLVTLVSA